MKPCGNCNPETALPCGLWKGDCIHPNETGAKEYARAVDKAAQDDLGF